MAESAPSFQPSTSTYKVMLIDPIPSASADGSSLPGGTYKVTFDVTPELNEQFSVRYATIDLLHAPGQVFPYQSTASRTFTINAKLISRTIAEATVNYEKIRLLKYWTMPAFGLGASEVERGRPPHVLHLSAYSSVVGGAGSGATVGHIRLVPVVITSLDLSYPSDVDYTFTKDNIPMPMVWGIGVNLTEAHSPREMEQFNLTSFAAGNLTNW